MDRGHPGKFGQDAGVTPLHIHGFLKLHIMVDVVITDYWLDSFYVGWLGSNFQLAVFSVEGSSLIIKSVWCMEAQTHSQLFCFDI